MSENIEQPTIDVQKRLDDILEATAEVIEIKKRKYRITWLSHGTIRKFSHIMVSEEDGYKRNVKLVAAVLLNNPFKMMWHWLYWRWLYYVRDISEVDVACVLNAAKKKTSARAVLSGYHISDRDDRSDDDDEKRGSTVYPSRTSWGAAYSLAQKYPFLFERRFGIRAYDYWWGYTAAQIELMAADAPFVKYKSNEGSATTKSEMDKLADRWNEKRKKQGSMAGKKISLSDYLRK